MVSVSGRFANLAPEDAVADDRVEQHQREDDDATPEHEPKTGLRRGGLADGDNEGNHVWPEGQRQGAECRYEDQRDHIERPVVVVVYDAEREQCCRYRANCREYEQIGSIDPAMQDWKVLGQRVGEHKQEECQYADREYGDLAARGVANLGVAFSDQPTG